LRLEDLDASRSRTEYAEACIADLRWRGLDWDGDPYYQSSRADELRAAALQLHERGLAYPCVCTRAEVQAAISAPHASERGNAYPGTCDGRFESVEEARSESGHEPALRFRCPGGAVQVTDELAGPVSLTPSQSLGDFPITSRDGQVAYHLAVVLDDAYQGVTEVLRGDDLLDSCGPQALIQEALGLPRPAWIHVPLVHGEDGQRLAKRSDGLSLRTLREAGVAPALLVRWLAMSCGLPDNGDVSPREALRGFDLNSLAPTAYVLTSRTLESLVAGELPSPTSA